MKFDTISNRFETKVLKGFGNDEYKVTNRMILKNGRPWIPVMGELHFSRFNESRWEDEIVKMKEGGIDIIATYMFWIHHEDRKGKFDFSGNKNIRRFIILCHKHNMPVFLRIGPWSHGEARNGGFPDWLCEECKDSARTEKEPYISYAKRYLRAICDQIRDLSLFGIQIENELSNRIKYMEIMRQTLVEEGIFPLMYTATGWGFANLPESLLPMFSGYPDWPWDRSVKPILNNSNFFFSLERNDGMEFGTSDSLAGKIPYVTCEIGGGNQVTYHRRPLISDLDIRSLVIAKIGSGMNWLGYYMYHGGIHPIGQTTTHESAENGSSNDYPIRSYDFQAPLGDFGQIRKSYYVQSRIHKFLHDFGEILAPMDAMLPDVLPADTLDTETLRCAFRTDGINGGFLFVNNHARIVTLPQHNDQPFEFEFKDRTIRFNLDIPSDVSFIMPVGIELAGLSVDYVTANPVSMGKNEITFEKIPGISPVIYMKDGREIELKDGVNNIDETEIRLVPPVEYKATELHKLNVKRSEPMKLGDMKAGHLMLQPLDAEYEVEWDENVKYLVIRAEGNYARFWAGGELVSDFYLYGDSWVIDVRDIEDKKGIIQYRQLTEAEREKIYLEVPFVTGIHDPEVFGAYEDKLLI